jgi:hypothetical protein
MATETGPSGTTGSVPAQGRLPDFVVIGSPKCGTTTLYGYLCRHARVFVSTPKEPEFFARDTIYAKGLDWYKALFKDAQPGQIVGEASTAYTRYPELLDSVPRLAEHLPHAKLIYMVRNPTDRAYSEFVQRVKTVRNVTQGGTQKEVFEFFSPMDKAVFLWLQAVEQSRARDRSVVSFEEYLGVDDRVIETSRYAQQIERYLKYYPREQLLLLFFEDLIADPAGMCQRVFQFLGVDERFDVMRGGPVVENTASEHYTHYVRSQTTSSIRSLPGMGYVRSALPQSWKDGAYKVLRATPFGRGKSDRYVVPPMLPETRRKLVEEFRQPNKQLAGFVGRDLSHWDR